jgi:hypothetical protein
MKRYFGGDKVEQGMYLNLRSDEFVDFNGEMTVLPGTSLNKFARVPRWLPFIAGPAAGLFFIILMPLVAIVAVGSGLAIKIGKQNNLHTFANRRTADLK